MTTSKAHNAIIYDNPGSLSLKCVQVKTPKPGPGQVLVRLSHTGLCHSDYAVMTNGWSWLPDLPGKDQVGGHEGVGRVVEIGATLPGNTVLWKVGDRVGIKWLSSACLHCLACMSSLEGSCLHPTVSGYNTPGTLQEYVLAPAYYVTPIPQGVSPEVAAPLLCGGLTVYSAFQKVQAKHGEWVVVSGAGGGLGHLACEIGSRALGFRILGIDTSEKEQFVRDCGAQEFLSVGDEALIEKVRQITGGGAALVMVCTGANAAYAQALDFLRFHGILMAIGLPERDQQLPIQSANPNKLITQQLTIMSSSVGNRKEAMEVLDLAARGIIKPKIFVHKPNEVAAVFSKMTHGQLLGRAVITLDSEAWA
ncbi:hypothetical protein LTR84_011370 [Exophiala bonariae]|uniref:Enoyl reductase (ER) domain-containing protein n=1 Tax=Exophiala bonariae TaxID=1690606 RepID=A0AAV9MSH8_9EURO|nr:hypothetical protein LTR84_011370 [Exophiala bonariae]